MRRLFAVITIVTIAVSLLPFPVMIWMSFFNQQYLVIPPDQGYTLDWYLGIPARGEAWSALLLSLLVGSLAALLATVVGFLAAYTTLLQRRRGIPLLETLSNLTLAVPSLIISVAFYAFWFQLQGSLGIAIVPGTLALVLVHAALTLPWAYRLSVIGLRNVHPDQLRASMSLGRGGLATALRVTIPLVASSLAGAYTMCFIFSMIQLEASLFLVRAGQTTLPVYMTAYAIYQVDPSLAALAVVQLVLVALLLAVVLSFGRVGRLGLIGVKK